VECVGYDIINASTRYCTNEINEIKLLQLGLRVLQNNKLFPINF
jgi:hypothetical protein